MRRVAIIFVLGFALGFALGAWRLQPEALESVGCPCDLCLGY